MSHTCMACSGEGLQEKGKIKCVRGREEGMGGGGERGEKGGGGGALTRQSRT
jgi:hypothetical protein